MYHGVDSFFACIDAPTVAALAYQLTDSLGTHTGTEDIACEAVGGTCLGGGTFGDDRVTIETDWANPGIVGCPVVNGLPQRIVLIVQASDGRGLIASLGGADPFGYLIEAAHTYDASRGVISPLSCTDRAGKPMIIQQTSSPDGQVTLTLRFQRPLVLSDCDPGSLGMAFGACTDNFQPNTALGSAYTRLQGCLPGPDLRRSLWTNTDLTPDANGDVTMTVTRPSATDCLFIGGTTLIGGFESGAITGFVRIPGEGCVDADGDGYTGCEGDCDDANAGTLPGHAEACDAVDNDCDGVVDDGLAGIIEICDGIDNNCDGQVDNQGACEPKCDQPQKLGGDLRVTQDPAISFDPAITSAGSGYGIAWWDDRDDDAEIYFSHLDASGAKIGTDVRVTNAPFRSDGPRIVWTGSEYGLAWTDMRNSPSALMGHVEIYFARLDGSGVKIGTDIRVTNNVSDSHQPALVWTGAEYGLVWVRQGDVFFTRLDASGARIEGETRVSEPPLQGAFPAIVWTGSEYGVTWIHGRDPAIDIYFARLDRFGTKIGGALLVTSGMNSPDSGARPIAPLAWNGSEYAIVWRDLRFGNPEIFFTRLTATGGKIGGDVRLTNDPANSDHPAIAWTGGEYGVAWSDIQDGNPEIYLARLDAAGARFAPDVRVTNDPSFSDRPALAWTGSQFALAWRDNRDGNPEIYFARIACRCVDGDGDGFSSCVDCDDSRSDVHPGASELCNGTDDDCDGRVDQDLGTLSCGVGECRRTIPSCLGGVQQVCRPGPPRAEVCDGLDNDCDGAIDDNAIKVESACSLSPATLNVNSQGTSFSMGLSLTNVCDPADPAPIDGALLGQTHVSRAGHIVLPNPSSLACPAADGGILFERGIFDNLADRTFSGPTIGLKFNRPADGDCRTLDGDRQDALALLSEVIDNTETTLCITGEAGGASFECCAAVTVRNRGNR